MDEEKLISLVSVYPELYDLENEYYMNQSRKNYIWLEISAILGVNDTICKEKWKGIRDAYHRSLKRRKTKSGDGAKKVKKWRYAAQMDILRPYFQERATTTNIMSDDEDDKFMNNPDTPASSSSAPVNSPRPLSRSTATPDIDTAPSPSSVTEPCTKSTVFKNITERKKKSQQCQSQVANILEKYLDKSRPAEPTSSIHSFFKAMADTVVSFSPDLQLKVKNKIYSVVSEAELENLNQTTCIRPDLMPASPVSITCKPHYSRQVQLQPSQAKIKKSNQMPSSTCTRSDLTTDLTTTTSPVSIIYELPENSRQIQHNVQCQPSQEIFPACEQPQSQYLIDSNGDITYEEYVVSSEEITYEEYTE